MSRVVAGNAQGESCESVSVEGDQGEPEGEYGHAYPVDEPVEIELALKHSNRCDSGGDEESYGR